MSPGRRLRLYRWMSGREGPVTLVIDAEFEPDDLPALGERVRDALEARDTPLLIIDVSAVTRPDVRTVDALARLQLIARRMGRRIRLKGASRELRELLCLMGLRDAVPCEGGSALEARGQAEEREELLGVEEEGDAADSPARQLEDLQ